MTLPISLGKTGGKKTRMRIVDDHESGVTAKR